MKPALSIAYTRAVARAMARPSAIGIRNKMAASNRPIEFKPRPRGEGVAGVEGFFSRDGWRLAPFLVPGRNPRPIVLFVPQAGQI